MAFEVNDDEAEGAIPQTLIKTFGGVRGPDKKAWAGGRRWELIGRRARDPEPDINVYEERGIYVLYEAFKPVYVGKAVDSSIGFRLESHRFDPRKKERWDRFSWFGMCGLDENHKLRPFNRALQTDSARLIATLEALLITVIDPRMNSRRERFAGAVQLYQQDSSGLRDHTTRLEQIEGKVDRILRKID